MQTDRKTIDNDLNRYMIDKHRAKQEGRDVRYKEESFKIERRQFTREMTH